MWTGQVQDKEYTSSEQKACQRIASVHPADAFVRWSPFQVLSMHTTFRRIERTSPDKERIRRMRNGLRRMNNGQETHVDGDERIENFDLRQTSLTLYGKVWLKLKIEIMYQYTKCRVEPCKKKKK